jgi:acyl carrier protein
VTPSSILESVRDFVLTRYLPGEDPSLLAPSTPLITGGILDSLAILELVAFLEQRYGIQFAAHELDRDRMDTLADIEQLVASKVAARP